MGDEFHAFGATGSVKEWFRENSTSFTEDGEKIQFDPVFDLFGPVTLDNDMRYYGANDHYGNDQRAVDMVVEACTKLDDQIDFSQYDTDGDGLVDNIYIFYAGYGEADGGGSNTIWPHSWDLSAGKVPEELRTFDGVLVEHYACSNETDRTMRRPDGIGTFVHEFSHVLGLPDLYATNEYARSYTPGAYSVLDYGPYNNEGMTPPNYSTYERYALGWIEPEQFPVDEEIVIPPLAATNRAHIVYTALDREYFLVENRVKDRWDEYLPARD